MACSQLWGTPLPLMYMSARRTGATELPREVAFQSQAAAAAGSLACMALANSSWPGSGLDLGLATVGGGSLADSRFAAGASGAGGGGGDGGGGVGGGGSLADSRLAAGASGAGFGSAITAGFCGVADAGGVDAAGLLSGVGVGFGGGGFWFGGWWSGGG